MSSDAGKKPVYEAPTVIALGELASGMGQGLSCSRGTGAGICHEGNAAVGGGCRNGDGNATLCRVGTYAGDVCVGGYDPTSKECATGFGGTE